jgi:hypothetical protein
VRIILQLVQSALEIDAGYLVKSLAVINDYALSPCDIELIEFRCIADRRRPISFEAPEGLAGAEINDLNGIVGGRSCEQPLMLRIHRHMVEPSLKVREGYGLH